MRNSTSHCDSRRSWPGGGGVLGGREVEKRKEVGSLGEPYLHVATRLREKEESYKCTTMVFVETKEV